MNALEKYAAKKKLIELLIQAGRTKTASAWTKVAYLSVIGKAAKAISSPWNRATAKALAAGAGVQGSGVVALKPYVENVRKQKLMTKMPTVNSTGRKFSAKERLMRQSLPKDLRSFRY